MHILKLIFLILLTIPLIYLSVKFISNLADDVLAKSKEKDKA